MVLKHIRKMVSHFEILSSPNIVPVQIENYPQWHCSFLAK